MSNLFVELGYHAVLRLGRRIRPGLLDRLYTLGLAVSPSLALADEDRRRARPMLRSTLALVPLVWLFSLVFNAFFSGLEGRLLPDGDSSTVNFGEDTANLILYSAICPLYVALSLQIIMVSSRYGRAVRDATRPASRIEASRSPTALSLCIAVAAVFAAKYVGDVAVGPDGLTYWFNDRINGVRVLNMAGVYYSLMTFGFLAITIMALLNYLAVTQASLSLANSVCAEDCSDLLAMQAAFVRFQQAYVYARWLIAVFMVHTVIWSRTPLAKTDNIHIAGAALVLAAFFLTAIPALHLNKKVEAAAQQRGTTPAELGIELVEPKKWLRWADSFIGIGFVWTLYGIEPIGDALDWLLGRPQI